MENAAIWLRILLCVVSLVLAFVEGRALFRLRGLDLIFWAYLWACLVGFWAVFLLDSLRRF